ncbi:MAG TPA: helicase-associated domain-containing protein [Actinomycetales bacterium]|nr:helicase-associated domain-containing protein [Actinomycetales bacterium]
MPFSVQQLVTTGPGDVERLLRLRPDVLLPPEPRDLRELAERLDDPGSVAAILHTADLAVLQAAEALQALGGRSGLNQLAALLDGDAQDGDTDADPAAHLGHVEGVLRWLADRALVRLDTAGDDPIVEASPGLAACFSWPLRLGLPAAGLHALQTAATLNGILSNLGLPRQTSKAAALTAVVELSRDADAVRAIAAQAPPHVADWLAWHCIAPQGGTLVADLGLGDNAHLPYGRADEGDDEGGLAALTGARFDPGAYRREQEAARWAADHGLVVPVGWGGEVQMPAEVALALRGSSYRAPFDPTPPAVRTHVVRADDVERESAASAAAFSEQASALLDLVARTPLPTLKAGGVGSRELTRLAKVLGTGVPEVRLVVETAWAAGLLEMGEAGVAPSARLATWRDQDPAQRFVALLRGWWRLGGVPTRVRDARRQLPALSAAMDCRLCAAARETLVSTLAGLPPGAAGDRTTVGELAVWSRPLLHAWEEDDAPPFTLTWREAELLGVVAVGALSTLGRRLLDEASDAGAQGRQGTDAATDALTATAAAMLPGTTDEAVFGSDHTVMATGAPSARVTRVLDAVADRESRGGAVVWRITPGSVRRALDEGATAEGLEHDLLAIARGGLPQPLRYLLQDVGRRHGLVRVRDVASCLRCDDPALLAQVAADRSLRRLGLRVLAPTVLVSAADARTTVEALRAAGYLPVAEDADGATILARGPATGTAGTVAKTGTPATAGERSAGERSAGERSAGERPAGRPARPDVAALAQALVRAGDPGLREPASLTEANVRRQAPHLSGAQARLLGHAVDTGTDVVIDYVAASGARTRRRVGDLALSGSTLYGWCHLRHDERFFSLSGIESVQPVAPTA